MYCSKCGHLNKDTSLFCGQCSEPLAGENKTKVIQEQGKDETESLFGNPAPINTGPVALRDAFESPTNLNGFLEPDIKQKKKKITKLPVIIAVVLVLLIGGMTAAVFGVSALNTKKYDELIDTGNKYLEELKYEEAVETFLDAIDIKPKLEEAYVGAAKGYIGLDEPDKARGILEKGLENVKEPGEEFKDLCDELGLEYNESGETKLTVTSETSIDPATQTTAIETTATTLPTIKPETTASSLSESELKAILSKKTKGPIVYFGYDDFDGDSKKEAFALVGQINDRWYDADVWFVNSNGADNLYHPDLGIEKDSLKIWDLGQQKIFKFELSAGGSGSVSAAWFVNNNKAVKIKYTGEWLTYLGEKNFTTVDGEFDAGYDSEYDSWSGHTYKEYYLYWDGSGFKEYGGIAISKAQLLQLKGAQEIINSIEQTGAVITDIFYRGNDIININYIKNYVGGYSADNATLKRSGNTVDLVQGYSDIGTDLENSSYGGIYKAAMTPSIAVYPSKIP